MKVVILAGGVGSRLSELTRDIPKPMVEIGGYPILWHIMNIYATHGYKDFIVALGYKASILKDYFLDYYAHHANLTIDLQDGSVSLLSGYGLDWRVTLDDTGKDTMTGGRIKRLAPYLTDTFMLTYGDGLSNVNISKLVEYHYNHMKMVTMTTIHPTSKYGKLEIGAGGQVRHFVEKPEFGGDWINGGFMVVEPQFLEGIDGDNSVLEREPLEKAAALGNLIAYKHTGFWHCMDTLRDRNELEHLWQAGNPPWRYLGGVE